MAQAKDSTPEAIALTQDEALQVERLLSLLVDLNIIDSPQEVAVTPTQPIEPLQNALSETSPIEQSDVEELLVLPVHLEIAEEITDTLVDSTLKAAVPHCEQLSISFDDRLNDSEALEQLQKLVLSESSRSHQGEPAELFDLLIPWVAELLNRTVAKSQAEVIQALSPIIDRVIEDRVTKNQQGMATALAPAMPSAITRQITNNSEEMSTAIAPMIGKALKKQIEIEQDSVVDALYPIIGGTISKYLAETVRAINQQVEDTLSVDGIKRKMRAKMQGVSEAELILREAMPFTVQAVFLIQKMSGLVIADIQRTDSQRLESDMIAGMLTAIRSFANDCIVQSSGVSELNEIDYGASKILLEVAGHCYLAIVVRGEPPKSFLPTVRKTLSHLIQDQGTVIEQFDGNPDAVPAVVNTTLEALRDAHAEKPVDAKKGSSPLLIIGLTIVSLIVIPFEFFQHRDSVHRQIAQTTTMALLSTPELAVYRLNAEVNSDKLKLIGQVPNPALRQKAEQIASQVTPKEWSIENHILAVEVPPDPVLTSAEVKRVAATFNQTAGIVISARHTADRVSIEGTISQSADAAVITQAFAQIPGVKSVSNTVQVQPYRLETRFYFSSASTTLNPSDLSDKLPQVQAFLKQQAKTHLKLIGHSQPSGNAIADQSLAVASARAVQSALISRGVDPSRLQIAGTIELPLGVDATQPSWLSRCVVLETVPLTDFTPQREK
jgi:outer membrane protein OmpA-like peptidoglycan-associated protein